MILYLSKYDTFSAYERLHLENKSSTGTSLGSLFWRLAQYQCLAKRFGCRIVSCLRYSEQVTIYGWNGETDVSFETEEKGCR